MSRVPFLLTWGAVALLGCWVTLAAPPAAPPALDVEQTVGGTERLLAMLDSPDPARQLAMARLISDRLPPARFGRRGAVFSHYAAPARRELSRKTWHREFAPAVRAFARALLRRSSMDEPAVGATMLVLVGEPDDLPAITAAMTRFVDRTCDPAAPPAYMPDEFTLPRRRAGGLLPRRRAGGRPPDNGRDRRVPR